MILVRMLRARTLLRMIELDRYRGGRCNGKFVWRLHHLEDLVPGQRKTRSGEGCDPLLAQGEADFFPLKR